MPANEGEDEHTDRCEGVDAESKAVRPYSSIHNWNTFALCSFQYHYHKHHFIQHISMAATQNEDNTGTANNKTLSNPVQV